MEGIRPHYLAKLDVLIAIIKNKFYNDNRIPDNVLDELQKLKQGPIIQDLAVHLSMLENEDISGLKLKMLAVAGLKVKEDEEPLPSYLQPRNIGEIEGNFIKRHLLDTLAPHLNIKLDSTITDLIESTYNGNKLDDMMTTVLKHFVSNNGLSGLYEKLKAIKDNPNYTLKKEGK